MEIISISRKVPKEEILPDGVYIGTWGGYTIILTYKKIQYELKTKEGVRGFNIKVIVTVKDGIATFIEAQN